MKRLSAAVTGLFLSMMLILPALAGNNDREQSHHQMSAQEQEGQTETVPGEVSQTQIDTVTEREQRQADVLEKLKVRTRNMDAPSTTNPDKLFQSSK